LKRKYNVLRAKSNLLKDLVIYREAETLQLEYFYVMAEITEVINLPDMLINEHKGSYLKYPLLKKAQLHVFKKITLVITAMKKKRI
jgi:hypothetical protein